MDLPSDDELLAEYASVYSEEADVWMIKADGVHLHSRPAVLDIIKTSLLLGLPVTEKISSTWGRTIVERLIALEEKVRDLEQDQ